VFPEEFPTFLTSDPGLRRILSDTHPELFDFRYWQARQKDIEQGIHGDVFPYPQELRFQRSQPGRQRLVSNA
jgi:isocitrate dehydrogenase kinase/phosphatase